MWGLAVLELNVNGIPYPVPATRLNPRRGPTR